MTSQEGRPFCLSGTKFLIEQGESRKLLQSCRECKNIIYIGCPGFKHKADMAAKDVREWIDWWYYNKPINHTSVETMKQEEK